MLAKTFSRVGEEQMKPFLERALAAVDMLHKTPPTYRDENGGGAAEYPFFTLAAGVLILWESKEEGRRWLNLCSGRGWRRELDLIEWLEGRIIG